MLKENGRVSTNKREVATTIKLMQTRNIMCDRCSTLNEIKASVFGEDTCNVCGSKLSEGLPDDKDID